jgi:membrane protein DedA with SNARE-associated domain
MDLVLQLMESYGYAAMFICMVLENANIPVPSEIVLGFAGFLISQNIFDFWTTFVVACAAGVVGSILSYWLGSYGGRPLLLKYGKYIFFNERKFNLAEKMFNKYGGIAVIICRCLPGVRTFISFPAGVARYPFGRFVLYTIIGTIPWTLLLVWAGSILGSHWRDLIQYNHEFLIATVIIGIIVAVVIFWKYKSRRRNVE